jgi:hypothetical protein
MDAGTLTANSTFKLSERDDQPGAQSRLMSMVLEINPLRSSRAPADEVSEEKP